MIDLYKRAIEKIQGELNGWNHPEKCTDYHYLNAIENIVIDLEDMLAKAKEIKLEGDEG